MFRPIHGHHQVDCLKFPLCNKFHYVTELWCGDLNISLCYGVSIGSIAEERWMETKTICCFWWRRELLCYWLLSTYISFTHTTGMTFLKSRTEGGSSGSHYVEESFYRRLWTCRQTEYWMNNRHRAVPSNTCSYRQSARNFYNTTHWIVINQFQPFLGILHFAKSTWWRPKNCRNL